jgi:Protein of unknown function (DUF3168)
VATVFEPLVAETWLQTRLTGDAALFAAVGGRIYNTAPPREAPRPYVVFQLQAGVDTHALSGSRPYARLVYLVRAIWEGDSLGAVAAAAGRIDAALQGQGLNTTAAGGHVLGCTRREAFQLAEFANGVRLNHRGGLYDVLTRGA